MEGRKVQNFLDIPLTIASNQEPVTFGNVFFDAEFYLDVRNGCKERPEIKVTVQNLNSLLP
jgi:hypothetical protein